MRRAQDIAVRLRSAAHSIEHKAGLLTLKDIATDALAQLLHCAVAVEQVVLLLEGEAEFECIAVNLLAVALRSITQHGTNHRGTRQQNGGLKLNHIHILDNRHLLALLEIHIVLLTLTHLQGHRGEDIHNARQFVGRRTTQQAVGINHHCIARQDGHILAPTSKDRGLAATHVGIIHNIVVQKREVMKHLYGRSGRQCILQLTAKSLTNQQQQRGTNTFAATRHRVDDGGIKVFRLLGELYLCEVIFKQIQDFFIRFHKRWWLFYMFVPQN